MAMDPGKLKAYMAGAAPMSEEYESEEMEPMEEGESEESELGDEMEVTDEEGFNDFLGNLYLHIDEIDEAAAQIAEPLTHDDQPSPETVEQMKEQLEPMPQEVKDGISEYLKGMEWEDVMALAQQFADADHIENPEQVCGWLYWIAKNV